MRQAEITVDQQLAGILTENEEAYLFEYEAAYLKSTAPRVVTFPERGT